MMTEEEGIKVVNRLVKEKKCVKCLKRKDASELGGVDITAKASGKKVYALMCKSCIREIMRLKK